MASKTDEFQLCQARIYSRRGMSACFGRSRGCCAWLQKRVRPAAGGQFRKFNRNHLVSRKRLLNLDADAFTRWFVR
jgi:hypothetical protein